MSLRAVNMQKRRERILQEARRAIGEGGADALNVRSLAEAADVTVPTIYNLIGSKDDVLWALIADAFDRVEARLKAFEDAPPLEMAEAVVLESTNLFAEDETYYRAAVVAGHRLGESGEDANRSHWVVERSVRMALNACLAARREGLLEGRIPARDLSEQMYSVYRAPYRDWANGDLSLETFRRMAMQGFYICLVADAAPAFRDLLMTKLEAVNTAAGDAPALAANTGR